MSDDHEDSPFWREIGEVPDDAFPLGLVHAPLVQAPERGALFDVVCCVCRRRGRITGLDICRRFPGWLTRDMVDWGRALTCEGCGSKRLSFTMIKDPAAGGFMAAAHLPKIARIERLLAWLPEGGMSLDDVAYLVRDMDAAKLRGAGLPEEVWQFWANGRTHSRLYRPGRNRRRPDAMNPPGGDHGREANAGESEGGRPPGAG